ncbi:hypothetical protein GCM10009602_19590 [Nocardiopsis tropica]
MGHGRSAAVAHLPVHDDALPLGLPVVPAGQVVVVFADAVLAQDGPGDLGERVREQGERAPGVAQRGAPVPGVVQRGVGVVSRT